jgi:hypothetical protein
MIYSVCQSPRILEDYTSFETRDLWTAFKDDPYVSDFIPIDPIREGSTEKTKAYLQKTNHFIQSLPRSNSLNQRIVTYALKSTLLAGTTPVTFAPTDESCKRIEKLADHVMQRLAIFELAKLRKKEDFAIILSKLIGNVVLDEADLEDALQLLIKLRYNRLSLSR